MTHSSLHTPVSLLQEHTHGHIHWVTDTNDTLFSVHTCHYCKNTHRVTYIESLTLMIHSSLHTRVSLLQEHTPSHIHWVTDTNDTLFSAHTCVTTARTQSHWWCTPPHAPLCHHCKYTESLTLTTDSFVLLLLETVITTNECVCCSSLCSGVPWSCLDITLVLCVTSWLLFSCLLLHLLFSLNFASFYQFLSMA